ncbi:MAG: hypothetical protein ACTSRW_17285 [Candidatus Helarchaeota archaeon]
MSVRKIKSDFKTILKANENIDPYEIRRIFNEVFRELEKERGWNDEFSGRPWTDDELRIVLSDAPTRENCLKHAKGFNRGYGAIEQIYRWASTSDKEIKRKRPTDKFVRQIKRIAKQLDWRA